MKNEEVLNRDSQVSDREVNVNLEENNNFEELEKELSKDEESKKKFPLKFLFIGLILAVLGYIFVSIYFPSSSCKKKNPLSLDQYKKLVMSNKVEGRNKSKLIFSQEKNLGSNIGIKNQNFNKKRENEEKLFKKIENSFFELKGELSKLKEDNRRIVKWIESDYKNNRKDLEKKISIIESQLKNIVERIEKLEKILRVINLKEEDLLKSIQDVSNVLFLMKKQKEEELRKLRESKKIGVIIKNNKKYNVYKESGRLILKSIGEE